MTLSDYFQSAENKLSADLQTFINVQIGNGALALIGKRVRARGEKAEGGGFKPYSAKPSLIGATSFTSKTHADKVFGKKKNKAMEWVTYKGHKLAVLEGGYKKIREIEGRQTDHKDFERTSELWKSIHVLGTSQAGIGRYKTVVSSTVPRSITIMEGIADREGSQLLGLSQSEQRKLAEILADKIKTMMS